MTKLLPYMQIQLHIQTQTSWDDASELLMLTHLNLFVSDCKQLLMFQTNFIQSNNPVSEMTRGKVAPKWRLGCQKKVTLKY